MYQEKSCTCETHVELQEVFNAAMLSIMGMCTGGLLVLKSAGEIK
jgi:hypothetical protein